MALALKRLKPSVGGIYPEEIARGCTCQHCIASNITLYLLLDGGSRDHFFLMILIVVSLILCKEPRLIRKKAPKGEPG
jgi:hypothetical protein